MDEEENEVEDEKEEKEEEEKEKKEELWFLSAFQDKGGIPIMLTFYIGSAHIFHLKIMKRFLNASCLRTFCETFTFPHCYNKFLFSLTFPLEAKCKWICQSSPIRRVGRSEDKYN